MSNPFFRKKQATPVLAYLVLEALAIISGVVVVVFAILAGVGEMSMVSWAVDDIDMPGAGAFNPGIIAIIFGAINAIGVGKFCSDLLISFSCALIQLLN